MSDLKQKNTELMQEVLKEISTHFNDPKIDTVEVILLASEDLVVFSLKEVAHKHSIPLSAVQKLNDILESPLSKSNEAAFIFFLKRVNFNYENYDIIKT